MPAAAPAQRRPYKLLLVAMQESSTGAIGRFVRGGRESLCLVRPRGEALVLETLYLVEDVYSQEEIDEAIQSTDVKKTELDLARQIINSLAADFEPAELTSEYRRDLRELLEAKLSGEPIAEPEPMPEKAPVIDLMEALKASVAAAKDKGEAAKKKPARKRARA